MAATRFLLVVFGCSCPVVLSRRCYDTDSFSHSFVRSLSFLRSSIYPLFISLYSLLSSISVSLSPVLLPVTFRLFFSYRRSFRPEFLNRISDIVFFRPLAAEDLSRVFDLQLAELNALLQENNQITVKCTPAAVQHMIRASGVDPAHGARPLKRYLDKHLTTELSKALLAGTLSERCAVTVDVADGKLTFSAQPLPPSENSAGNGDKAARKRTAGVRDVDEEDEEDMDVED